MFPPVALASCSSPPSHQWRYDVFPSFRGADVRKSFLSHFLSELKRNSIIAFIDDKIVKSESIAPSLVQAIKESRIAVVVFSKNYSSSSWCLNELLEIMKCKKDIGQMVIPIFYDLDPSHLREQSGEFGEAFKKTCENQTEELINQWKQALTDAATIGGYHCKNCDSEATMVEEISCDILGKLSFLSNNFEEFVGIEYHIEEMRSLLRLDSEEVRMVGIWGTSGIGKTIIARALFSNLSGQFQRSIFLDRAFISECKEGYGRPNFNDYNMKKRLQGKFLSEIMNQKSMRIGPMEERLKHEKVLIFIDDLDDPHVLNALAGQTRWFGSGSRIIVVTTDRSLLKAHGIRFTYEVHLPSHKTALEIFCGAAFKQNYPPDGLMEFASEVVERAGRLPLGLNVLGLSLRGLNKEKCLKMLPRLRGSLDGSIEETLRVSYDVLRNENDKKLFRYIACLFPEIDYMLPDFERLESFIAYSGLDDGIGLDNLVDKALIHHYRQWDYSRLEIHRLLQDMGKTIVRNQSKNPGEREYIMDSKDICDVLKDATGTSKVLGISLDTTEIDEFHVHENAFKSMSDLSFLKIKGYWFKNLAMSTESKLQLPESFDHLPPKLKCLYWSKYPMKRMPSTFHPHNLIKLILEESKLEKLWEGVKSLTCLKKMDLRDSKYLKEIPDLSMATNLEKLILNSCTSLVELPSSIRNLNKLKKLSMRYCTKLETLPSGINLESLKDLDLAFCSRLKSFPDISTNISTLNLIKTAIEEVPWWIGKFYLLKDLYMNKCSQLKYVHPNLYKLKHLRDAKFDNCEALIRDDSSGYSSGKDAEAYSSYEEGMILYRSGFFSSKEIEKLFREIRVDNPEEELWKSSLLTHIISNEIMSLKSISNKL